MIIDSIKTAFETSRKKGWTKMYFAVDIHGTMIKPNYQKGNIPTDFYTDALESLQLMSKRDDIVLILYTCSNPDEIIKYKKLLKDNLIYFRYANKNPEVENESYGYYDDKFYFSVLLDDKAGFNPHTDWKIITEFLLNEPEL
jgi:hypothetical protein